MRCFFLFGDLIELDLLSQIRNQTEKKINMISRFEGRDLACLLIALGSGDCFNVRTWYYVYCICLVVVIDGL